MDDDDCMQVDTGTENTQGAHKKALRKSVDDALTEVLNILRECLDGFIKSQLMRVLGDDVFKEFLPPDGSCEVELLRFVQKKWLGVFCDSPIENRKDLIQQLLSLTRTVRSTSSESRGVKVVAGSENRLGELGQLVESLLMLIAPSQAAQIADVVEAAGKSTSGTTRRRERGASQVTTGGVSEMTGCMFSMAIDRIRTDTNSDAHAGTLQTRAIQRWTFSGVPVVLDGSNISWRHGHSREFSMGGAILAFRYFEGRGHDAILFLPETRVSRLERMDGEEAEEGNGDNGDENGWVKELVSLQRRSRLVVTPAGDYDDAYVCDFARRHAAVVVSNDAFRDVVYQADAAGGNQARRWDEWLSACRLTFTFRGDEFLPNPAFFWDRAANVAARLRVMP